MPGQTIGINLNNGYPGTFSRQNVYLAVSRVAGGNIPFGSPVKYDSDGNVVVMGASDTAAKFLGIASRNVKQSTVIGEPVEKYAANEIATIVTMGAVSAVCNVGDPTVNGNVYLRITANESVTGGVVGGLEATADGANSVLLTNVRWNINGKDENGVSEIRILYPVNA
ncbi:hypothetical protein DWV16_17175 [Anaerotruncus sp. AF02-27]|uniref:structural cement protein Gp24 n=1 Tax=Anaerotruncus sp. AF02-27 TaxID=2292191 RepID=UPI000E4B12F4|nr:hypothetical protein [Anaerotruncus sp. AF02-27]RGX53183.1 hypothetical protein DWV16_17175 [Anaerotruncus sp. AF02-27]